KDAWDKFKQESEKLSPGEKQQLREEREKRGLEWVKRETEKEAQKLDRFFKLSKEEQLAELNKDIDEQQERMEHFRKKMADRGNRGEGGEGRGRGPRGRGNANQGGPQGVPNGQQGVSNGQPGTPNGTQGVPNGQPGLADGPPKGPGPGRKGTFGKGNEAP